MNHIQWLSHWNPDAMWSWYSGKNLHPKPSVGTNVVMAGGHPVPQVMDKKLSRLLVALVRDVRSIAPEEFAGRCIDVAERFAIGEATAKELNKTRSESYRNGRCSDRPKVAQPKKGEPRLYSWDEFCLANAIHWLLDGPDGRMDREAKVFSWSRQAKYGHQDPTDELPSSQSQCAIVRDIFPDPWLPGGLKCSTAHSRSQSLSGLWDNTTRGIAEAAYLERNRDGTLDAGLLAILADALEDRGCDDDVLLAHLRGMEYVGDQHGQPLASWIVCQDCGKGGRKYVRIVRGNCEHCGSKNLEQSGSDVWIPIRGPHHRGCWALDAFLFERVGRLPEVTT